MEQRADTGIYLASNSPRRQELLRQIGVPFKRLPSGCPHEVDEAVRAGEAVEAYVLRLAAEKAQAGRTCAAALGLPPLPVLGADTAVAIGGITLGKPADAAAATAMLERLSGRIHRVLTGVAVAFEGGVETALSATEVEFKALSPEEVRRYVATGESLDKAGAYAVQGRAAVFVRRLSGSYSGVVGLPLFETAALLTQLGVELS
ncbi:MAG: Maf family protein [Betaproteobacteria bacterium]|nr:Maf family protein [Betaproteobacteria bacterium]